MSAALCCDGGQLRAVVQPAPQIVARLAVQQGPAGRPGLDGVGDSRYVHLQSVVASVWTVAHSLGKFPSVTVIDSAGDECEGAVEYLSANSLRLTFTAPFSGTAYLN